MDKNMNNVNMATVQSNSLKWKMESLRGAADKIKRSPRLVRKKINNALNKEKLTEDWIHNREQVELGVMFNLKVLGKTETDIEQGKGCTDKIVEELVQKNKVKSKTEKLRKASVMIDCDKLVIRDLISHQLIDDIPVKRICFCTADPTYPKVFAFMVAGNDETKPFIYAFLTNKKTMADAIALTVAQAYTMSYEIENENKQEKKEEIEKTLQEEAKDVYSNFNEKNGQHDSVGEIGNKIENTKLIVPSITNTKADDSKLIDDEEEDEFMMFAQSRNELEIGHIHNDAFSSDITDFLAVNNTLGDLERAKSHDDLFSSNFFPEYAPSSVNRNLSPSPTPLSGRSTQLPSPQPNTTDDLIQF